ncbi:ATP-dependent RNA helicase SUV3 homolog, mitochondrial isoform X1 [Microplitis mediator]|uniref:ATP-dependent RNA helicase SUV3 homolog, mitochondrial isoform X1 n=2 Tax=Microplitis mediator TaxID=375433 RepID=UPI002555428C|nr:ATP-dependent RNA helicase SUV3 homolog, mitochondrial isoform X1 [Microplitis mediator]
MFSVKNLLGNLISQNSYIKPKLLSRSLNPLVNELYRSKKSLADDSSRRGKKRGSKSDSGVEKKPEESSDVINSLFHPVPVLPDLENKNLGAEITSKLNRADVQKVLATFHQQRDVRSLAKDYGLTENLQRLALNSFRVYCDNPETLPVDLYVIISDILQGAGHVTDIFPYFIRHAKEMFPHLDCMDELKQISDLRNPANWYPLARVKKRKIIFHAGPTNSGKTYQALERFRTAKSGVYCGPLKLLATEVYNKINSLGTPCDLVTGEERLFGINENNQAEHIACTVEMARINIPCQVAVIDEIQLLKDTGRGWAWTRALLGIPADEVHLCGEAGAIDLVRKICLTMGEEVEVMTYRRLTELKIEDTAVSTLNNIQPGDCIVCFSKADIYTLSRELELLGIEVAVIYGGLPPNTKLGQAAKFNDPNHPCKVMVATDAIGMGLNLNIRRVIFYSLIKPTINDDGEKEIDLISVSAALQIAGRAGRHGSHWETGFVTTFKPEDLPRLKNLLTQTPEPITKAGLHPTADQIELYAYHLPKSTLSSLMDIFISLSTVDDALYFMCNLEDFKFLADKIQHVPLPLRARYVFCCAPINRKLTFLCSMFLNFARQYSKNEPITASWLCQQISWPVKTPKTILDLVHLEGVFDVLDLYLWLSYRFMDLFPDTNEVREVQRELDLIIQDGIIQLNKLLTKSEAGSSETLGTNEDNLQSANKNQRYSKEAYVQNYGRGKLTERLLAQGLLTPNMIAELQREWARPNKSNEKRASKKTEFPRKTKCMCES